MTALKLAPPGQHGQGAGAAHPLGSGQAAGSARTAVPASKECIVAAATKAVGYSLEVGSASSSEVPPPTNAASTAASQLIGP